MTIILGQVIQNDPVDVPEYNTHTHVLYVRYTSMSEGVSIIIQTEITY